MQIQASGSDINGAFELIGAVQKVFGNKRLNTFQKIFDRTEIIAENLGFCKPKYKSNAGSGTEICLF